MRTIVLVDERDRRLGKTQVPEATFVVVHKDAIFVRTESVIRLSGGGIGVVFLEFDPLVRNKLELV